MSLRDKMINIDYRHRIVNTYIIKIADLRPKATEYC